MVNIKTLLFLLAIVLGYVSVLWLQQKPNKTFSPPQPAAACSVISVEETITPVLGTKHFVVAAYADNRDGRRTRIIGIINRHSGDKLYCVFCCGNRTFFSTTAEVQQHSDHFGFPYVTTDLLCETAPVCKSSHVMVRGPSPSVGNGARFLPIQNQHQQEDKFPYEFTVCISNLFGNYNNVLQFIQTLEVYKILGIQKVMIYKTNCSQTLDKVLSYYKGEGFVEIIPWPITTVLNPSHGWNYAEHKGDLHYYGQLTTLNDCIYRNMYSSKYVLLNDIDEIIAPYKHRDLHELMEYLSSQNPKAGVFLIENHIYPKNVFDETGRYSQQAEWKNVPGINILEHVHREPDRKEVYNPTKMIVNPRRVEQTSVHSVLKHYGESYRVPPDVSKIVHVRVPLQGQLSKEALIRDTKLWEYADEVIKKTNKVIKWVIESES